MKMRLYYIAYDYGEFIGLDMISGPFGTASEARQERQTLLRFGDGQDDEKLVIVRKTEEFEKVDCI